MKVAKFKTQTHFCATLRNVISTTSPYQPATTLCTVCHKLPLHYMFKIDCLSHTHAHTMSSAFAQYVTQEVELTLESSLSNSILVVYTDNPVCEQWSGVVHSRVVVNIHLPPASSQLLVRWYADVCTKENLVAQQYLGGGACAIGETEIALIDVTSSRHGRLSVRYTAPTQVRPVTRVPIASSHLVKQVQAGFKHLQHKRHDDIASVSVLIGSQMRELPLLWYPLLAMRMSTLTKSSANATWSRLVQLAQHFHPGATDGQVLAEALAFPSLGWRYCADLTPSGVYADSWSSLFTFPNPERAAFDCEDGAHACLELFHVLLGLEVEDGDLARIQRLARQYTPFLAVGEIKSEKKYVLHCFLVLLDTEKKRLPAIHVETTSFGSGEWHTGFRDRVDEDEREYTECSDAWPDARIRSPISMVHDQKMYGRLLALFGCTRERARHWLLHTGNTLGVDTNAFLLNPSAHATNVVVDMPTAELQKLLAHELSMCPTSSLPLPTTLTGLPKSRRCVLLPDGVKNKVGVMGKMALGHCID